MTSVSCRATGAAVTSHREGAPSPLGIGEAVFLGMPAMSASAIIPAPSAITCLGYLLVGMAMKAKAVDPRGVEGAVAAGRHPSSSGASKPSKAWIMMGAKWSVNSA